MVSGRKGLKGKLIRVLSSNQDHCECGVGGSARVLALSYTKVGKGTGVGGLGLGMTGRSGSTGLLLIQRW